MVSDVDMADGLTCAVKEAGWFDVTGDVRRRPIKGLRLRMLQFTGGSDEGCDRDEWSDPGLEAAVCGAGSA